MKFKVGDKVRCLQPDLELEINEIYTIKEIKYRWDEELFFLKETNSSWNSCRFELVESNTLEKQSNETEKQYLQRLVDKANEGEKSVLILKEKYSDKFEFLASNEKNWTNTDFFIYGKYRIKPNSHKFKVASWEAEILGDKIKIGCKEFNKNWLKTSLKDLLKFDSEINYIESKSNKIWACRKGISGHGHTITWSQAEELLKELEK